MGIGIVPSRRNGYDNYKMHNVEIGISWAQKGKGLFLGGIPNVESVQLHGEIKKCPDCL